MTELRWRRIMLILWGAYGGWVLMPFLAPVLMYLGQSELAGVIYRIYSFFCHQLPQRSFFLFGTKPMYTLAEIQAAWKPTTDPLVLRQFIGNPIIGWKVAWSDRMVSFYTSIWVFTALRWFWSPALSKHPNLMSLLFLAPMAVDGFSHLVSDLSGIDQGFRANNLWLVVLTDNALPPWFYAGDALGSFNSWMRLFTGLLAGWGIADLLVRCVRIYRIYKD